MMKYYEPLRTVISASDGMYSLIVKTFQTLTMKGQEFEKLS